MSHAKHSSFLDLTTADFKTYAEALVGARSSGAQRQRAAAFLQKVAAGDAETLKTERDTLSARRTKLREQREALEGIVRDQSFDYEAEVDLFTDESISDAELVVKLGQDNSQVFLKKILITSADLDFSRYLLQIAILI